MNALISEICKRCFLMMFFLLDEYGLQMVHFIP